MTVANRTLERGAQLASRVQGKAITLNELPERLAQFDIIVTSTASSLPILGKGMLERAIKARRHAPMFIVDLAVPRDVEPEASELDDVFLYSIDDLAGIVKDSLQIRVDAVREAEAMIAEQAESFLRWLEGRVVVPTITALHGHHDALSAQSCSRCSSAFIIFRKNLNGRHPGRALERESRDPVALVATTLDSRVRGNDATLRSTDHETFSRRQAGAALRPARGSERAPLRA